MANWQVPSVQMLRVLTNDLEETPTYSDDRLTDVLIISGFQLLRAAKFSQDFVVDINEQTILPDPLDVVGNTNDYDFINLMCIKAACIIDTGSAIKAASLAVSTKDFDMAVDLKGVATSTLALLSKGWCATYETLLDDFLSGNGVLVAAVTGPFRTRARSLFFPGEYNYMTNYNYLGRY